MCIDFFFLIKEHKALKNNCSSLQHFTFHTRQKAQPPPASEKREEEPHGAASPGCQWPPCCPGPLLGLQTPWATNTSPASDQVLSLSGLMFPHLYWRRKRLRSYLPLSGSAQRVKELMFIKCSASQRKTMVKTLGVVMGHSRPHFQGS